MTTADVVVAGAGLIGSACALAVADRGADVAVVSRDIAGAASPAAAGLLAPSIERAARSAEPFAVAARAMFPSFVAEIEERSGVTVPIQRSGILEIALEEAYAIALRKSLRGGVRWLDDREIHELEPAVAATFGGVLWEEDGCVDNVALLTALRAAVQRHPRVRTIPATVAAIERAGAGAVTLLDTGERAGAAHVVLAAGAWACRVAGASYAVHVQPVRGQIVVLDRQVVRRPVYSDDSYIVPRGDCSLVGSTMEPVGFDPATTQEGVAGLCAAAARLCPGLAGVAPSAAWAGLRPVTPDLLPMIGPDPHHAALIYACGHSRNGVLMAPATAAAVAELVFEDSLTFDLRQFRPDRFTGTFRQT